MTHPSDKILFAQIQQATAGSRALLCTLGRLGKAFRRDHFTRAEMMLLASQTHPVYKGGRLLFDLLELEDLLLDGPQPPPLDHESLTKALRSTMNSFANFARVLVDFFREVSPDAENNDADAVSDTPPPPQDDLGKESSSAQDLPELQASEYIFDLIVLGLLSEIGTMLAAGKRAHIDSVPEEPGTPEG